MERTAERGLRRRGSARGRGQRRRRALRDHRVDECLAAVHRRHRRYEELARALRSTGHLCPHTLTAGDVVWARVDFDDNSGHKVRPVVVLTADYRQIVGLAGTSNLDRGRALRHVELVDLDAAGLDDPTAVDPVRPRIVPAEDLLLRAGRCSAADWEAVTDELARVDLRST